MRGLFILLCVTGFLSQAAFAQSKIGGQNTQDVKSSYTVTDDAVFVYFIEGKGIPYKVYDFSTRNVYVYFGTSDASVIAHDFDSLAEGEVDHILDIGCGAAQFNNSFKRFCR